MPSKDPSIVNLFQLLPDEIVINILSFLNTTDLKSVALICKRFNCICFDFWTKLTLPEKAKLSQTEAFILLAKCSKVLELSLMRRERDEDATNLAINALKIAPKLVRLKVNYCSQALLKAVSNSNSLSALTVMCWDSEYLMGDYGLLLPNLKELALMFCSPRSMEAMGNYCLNLDILNIGPGIFGNNLISLVGAIGQNLKELNMYEIGDGTFQMVLSQCPLLEKLEVESAHLSGLNFERIFSGLKRLRILKLGNCWKLNDNGMLVLAENCKELTELTLFGSRNVTKIGLKQVLENCHKLKYLHFRKMHYVPYKVVKEVRPQALEYIIWGLVDLSEVGKLMTPMQWKVDTKQQTARPQLVPYRYPFTSARY